MIIKNKKIVKKRVMNLLLMMDFMMLLLSLGGIIISCFFFYSGFHNVDLAHNALILQHEFGIDFSDMASDFNNYTMPEVYVMGQNQMRAGFIIFGICMFLFVVCLYASFEAAMENALLERIKG